MRKVVGVGRYSGEVAVVTGGASGIGYGIGRRLAAEGATVVVVDIDADAADKAAAELGGWAAPMDVGDAEAWRGVVQALTQREGRCDIAVLNAGIATGARTLDELGTEQYRRIMRVNVDGVVFGARALIPLLRAQQPSSILATASLAGLTPVPMDPVYAATKHAVVGLVRSLAEQLRPDGIRVQALCPGFADTAIVTSEERQRLAEAGLPLIDVDHVVDTAMAALTSDHSGEAWIAQLGREPTTYRFRGVPGARVADGSAAPPPTTW